MQNKTAQYIQSLRNLECQTDGFTFRQAQVHLFDKFENETTKSWYGGVAPRCYRCRTLCNEYGRKSVYGVWKTKFGVLSTFFVKGPDGRWRSKSSSMSHEHPYTKMSSVSNCFDLAYGFPIPGTMQFSLRIQTAKSFAEVM